MTIIKRTRLRIRDQHELLNQIAGTYKDVYRAAMEYVDNAVDAATDPKRVRGPTPPTLQIDIDSVRKTLSFTDNCGGMSPGELCDLLSEVGRSKKKAVAWANGQFGFGVHAFRAFAREAVFISRTTKDREARIKINRSFDETVEVVCEATDGKQLGAPGTRVVISHFDPRVFRKATFLKSLVSEIEHHFDDVLRAGLLRISVTENGSRSYECQCFDFHSLGGTSLARRVSVTSGKIIGEMVVDLRILDRPQDNRLAVLMNKRRRVQTIFDLRSYKAFARDRGESVLVWQNPFVVGSIEINDLCSPTLSRDDLLDSEGRETVYECPGSAET